MNVGLALLTLFPGRVGGAETYVRGLLAAYAAGDGPPLTTVLASRVSEPSLTQFVGPRIDVATVSSYRPGNSKPTRLIAMEAARLRKSTIAREVPLGLDLIHYPVTVPIPDLEGMPKVVTLLDVQHRDLPQMFSRAEIAFRRWAYDRAAVKADHIITNTNFSASRIVHHLGVNRDKIHVIHLGIDHHRFTAHGQGSTLPHVPGRYVYYPANGWPHKNHDRLLEAFDRVNDPLLHLVLTGHTLDSKALRKRHPRVVHLGHVAEDQIAPLYRGAEALIFPSLYEGFGFPPLEAMACGCPVAASDTGAAAEVCGDAALLFDPENVTSIADAISRISTDEPLRASLRERGLSQAANFTWEQSARGHDAVYQIAVAR